MNLSSVPSRAPRILAFVDYYLPGYRSGGPVRTIKNMTDALGERAAFFVVTADHDLGETQPYESVTPGVWQRVGQAVVYYRPRSEGLIGLLRTIKAGPRFDVIYLNSVFSIRSTVPILLLRRLGFWRDVPVLLAPRGEFSPGALGLKRLKKAVYLAAARALGLYRGLRWQASSGVEREDIVSVMGPNAPVSVAMDCPERRDVTFDEVLRGRQPKVSGELRLVFLSRISPMKNLLGALGFLCHAQANVTLDVWGPIEDPEYWAACEARLRTLPAHVQVEYRGTVAHEDVAATLVSYDALLLPTLGENFGHAIYEALLAGCPVILSDQTPWRNLESIHAGWDLPLDRSELFIEVIEQLAAMDDAEHRAWVRGAFEYGRLVMLDDAIAADNLRMFTELSGELC